MNIRPATKAFLELLTKNGPMTKEAAILAYANLVPPGQALRTFAQRHTRPTTRTPEYEDQIASGQRAIATTGVWHMIRDGTLTYEDGLVAISTRDQT